MAVYERNYHQYAGLLTPEWSRFLILPRHAFRDVFRSKLFTAFFVICFVPLLIEAILIYLHHNANALAILRADVRQLLPIDASFFETFVGIQSLFAFLVTLLVGPPLVARDVANNALPLYLCRPFSRSDYVLGKMSVLVILLSTITWIPSLVLFLFQAYLEGFSWFSGNLWLGSAIFFSSLMWILVLTLLSQAISAWVKWRVAASAALIGLYLIPSVFAAVVNNVFTTRWGNIISVEALRKNVTAGLFGTFERTAQAVTDFGGPWRAVTLTEPALWCSWLALLLLCGACLGLISSKVKAYEVIK
jgi:ABC-2 type transport system permease protein